MKRYWLALPICLLITACAQLSPIPATPTSPKLISRDRAEAIALDDASKNAPEIEVIQTHPKILDAQLTTLAKAVEISDPDRPGDTGQDDPNQRVWLVTVQGSWRNAAPLPPNPKITPNPTAGLLDHGKIIINASTGQVMQSFLYPPSVNSTPALTQASSPEVLCANAF